MAWNNGGRMSNQKFTGYLGRRMREHLELRRSLGRCYNANEATLLRFNHLIEKRWPRAKTVTREMVMAVLRSNRHLKTISRKNELTYIRMFCTDLAASGVSVYMPERKLLPKVSQDTRIHIFSESEILLAMNEAKNLKTQKAMLNYPTLIGLFWTTGLRLQEALSINVGEIDWDQRLLFVRLGKFGKSRYVPISRSTVGALREHLKKMRSLGLMVDADAPLFSGHAGRRLSKSAAGDALHGLYRKARIKTQWGGYPRTHDLRHSFATHSLKAIRDQGRDPSSHVPALAVVMGHSDLTHTQIYLHPTIETLQKASRAFRKKLFKSQEEV
jgi:integrase/recombinase XerD